MLVMSTPMAEIDGVAYSRVPMVPEPVSCTPSRRSAPARKSFLLRSAPSHSWRVTPSTATVPLSSTRVASSFARAIMASGRGPAEHP